MLTIFFALAMVSTQAQNAGPQNLTFKSVLKTVVVFKEGFGFFIREGTAKLEDGWAATNLVPQAVRGTLWVYLDNPNDRVDTIIITKDNRIEFETPVEISNVLADKIGLALQILTKDDRVLKGELTNLLDEMLLIKDESKNYVAIEYEVIEAISLINYPVRIKLKTGDPNGEAGIGLAYVQEGVRWQPSYLLELLPGNTGRLTLRGTLLDLLEELKDGNIVFVVGAPTLSNRGQLDDLIAGFRIEEFFVGKAPSAALMEDKLKAGAELEKAAGASMRREGMGVPFGALSSDESGELQYYTKTNFSLRPGERAMATIFETVIPVTPLFEWNADGEDVIYILTLENSSEHPLTTGPVFVVENRKPVGQQQIKYTAPGDEAELRLAKGIGIKVERHEAETGRGDPFKIGERQFLPITIKGTLTLENFRGEKADVRITRTVRGKVINIGGGGVLKDTTVSSGDPNATNLLEWEVSLPGGGKLEIEYTYESYTAIQI